MNCLPVAKMATVIHAATPKAIKAVIMLKVAKRATAALLSIITGFIIPTRKRDKIGHGQN
jgi:hypothetical protein